MLNVQLLADEDNLEKKEGEGKDRGARQNQNQLLLHDHHWMDKKMD